METTVPTPTSGETTLLYVDDDEDTRRMIGTILHRRYKTVQILFAGDGIDALLKVVERSPDIILLDIFLPCLDGFTLAKKILTDNRESKVVVVSGCSDPVVVDGCLALGIAGYVSKPIYFPDFFQLLDELIGMEEVGP
ncbi:response regulator [Geomesophilobacter sediminis]|uniref:Response regulator n=1 Tax=Geomesophilobacter sediminis TaxID=2798584 RepID=A0A8J7JEN3_9BACT|nr:response regulator [Geomesophilobacter sediminis]MBJ6725736.1 response regulator [Geomesophilobacter sediminis]